MEYNELKKYISGSFACEYRDDVAAEFIICLRRKECILRSSTLNHRLTPTIHRVYVHNIFSRRAEAGPH